MNKKTTFSSTIRNYWNIRTKNDLTGKINVRKIVNYILIMLLATCGVVYNTMINGVNNTMLSSFMIVVAILTAALFVISFNTLQIYREIRKDVKLYTTTENIVVEKLRTIIDYGISMGFITIIFIGVNLIVSIDNAPEWITIISLTIIGLLITDFVITVLKTVKLVRVVNIIML